MDLAAVFSVWRGLPGKLPSRTAVTRHGATEVRYEEEMLPCERGEALAQLWNASSLELFEARLGNALSNPLWREVAPLRVAENGSFHPPLYPMVQASPPRWALVWPGGGSP